MASRPSTSASPYVPSPIPTRTTNQSIPRPPPSPLRPGSPSSLPPTPRRTASLTSPALNTSSAPSTPPQNKTRARDLLRKHYGLGVGPPPALRSDGGGRVNDPMDLDVMQDSTAFDAKTYYEQLITTSSLPTLLKRENDLLTEIRQLDSERQSLVYNHHHELIAASDTIAAMKTRAESLDADLDLLRASYSEISRLGAEVAIEQNEGANSKRRSS